MASDVVCETGKVVEGWGCKDQALEMGQGALGALVSFLELQVYISPVAPTIPFPTSLVVSSSPQISINHSLLDQLIHSQRKRSSPKP